MRVTLSFSPGFAAFFAACGVCPAATLSDYLDAIEQVESNGNARAVGDNGRSHGAYQIQRAYWIDSDVPWPYADVFNKAKSRLAVIGYARRYEPAALRRGDWETLARLHNAGPGWRNKRAATNGYWKRVQAAMRQKGK